MARAYIALNRNDLPDNLLQFIDVEPNTSQMRGAHTWGAAGAGQTGYITYTPQNVLPVTSAAPGPFTMTGDTRGLAAYIMGNVEDVGDGHIVPIPADALAIADDILGGAMAGQRLDITAINAHIVVTLGAGSDLNGALGGSNSTGSVEEVLRILSGEVYQVDDGTVIAGAGPPAGAWVGGNVGSFVATTHAQYRPRRIYYDTGSLGLSALSEQLSKLQAAAYSWLNPSYTYGAAGTALFTDRTNIPATGVGRAVTVYAADGTLL